MLRLFTCMRIFNMKYKLMKNNWDFLNFILSFWIMDLKSYRRRRHAFAVFNIHPFTCQTLLSLFSMKMSISRSGRTGIGQFYSIIQKKESKKNIQSTTHEVLLAHRRNQLFMARKEVFVYLQSNYSLIIYWLQRQKLKSCKPI